MSVGSRVPYIANVIPEDWNSVLRFSRDVQKYMSTLANSEQTIYTTELFITGSTASRLLATDASQEVVSTDLASWVTGTANQVIVTDDTDGTITLSTPQDINTTSSPTWVNNTLTGYLTAGGNITSTAGEIRSGVLDTYRGFFRAYGHATGNAWGGTLYLEPSADYDTDIGAYILSAYEDDFVIQSGGGTSWFRIDGPTGGITIAGTLESVGVATLADASLLKTSAAPTTDAMIANKKYVDDSTAAPAAHVHDGDTLQLDGINSDGGAFSFDTTGTVTFNESITMSAGKDLTIPGHIIFNTNNSYIGFANPRITFNDTDDRLELTGGLTVSEGGVFQIAGDDLSVTINAHAYSALQVVNNRSAQNTDSAFDFYKSRGTPALPTTILDGDWLTKWRFFSHNGTAFAQTGGFIYDTYDIGNNYGKFKFYYYAGNTFFHFETGAEYTRIGDITNADYINISTANGDLTFVGDSGFYPRRVTQSAEPANGTGVTQIDVGELIIWRDPDDNKTYLLYQDTDEGVRKSELT